MERGLEVGNAKNKYSVDRGVTCGSYETFQEFVSSCVRLVELYIDDRIVCKTYKIIARVHICACVYTSKIKVNFIIC